MSSPAHPAHAHEEVAARVRVIGTVFEVRALGAAGLQHHASVKIVPRDPTATSLNLTEKVSPALRVIPTP